MTPGNSSPLDRPTHPEKDERHGQPEDVPPEANGHGQNIPSSEHDPEQEREEEGDDPDAVQPRTHPAFLPPLPADHRKSGGDEDDRETHHSRNDPGRTARVENVRGVCRPSDDDRNAGEEERQEKEDAQEGVFVPGGGGTFRR